MPRGRRRKRRRLSLRLIDVRRDGPYSGFVLDQLLRPVKDRLIAPIARTLGSRLHPTTITLAAAAIGIAAAVLAWSGRYGWACALWITNRVVDGLDGAVARQTGRQSDYGGYLDMLLDVVVYSAVPIGFALGVASTPLFIAVIALLAAFYLNITSWLYLSALLEKRAEGGRSARGSTSILMPSGVVEGTETIVAYGVMLLWPAAAIPIIWILAAATLAGVAQRIAWARRHVR